MHGSYRIEGGNKLSGAIAVNGAKNAALKIMAAAILSDETCTITNLPDLEDIRRMTEILSALGIDVKIDGRQAKINAGNISKTRLERNLVEKIRASILIAGPLLVRTGEIFMAHPGGCNIGKRPIDMFLDGFKELGITVKEIDDGFLLRAKKIYGGRIVLPRISHTVTEAMMMTAVLAEGITTIENAAMEPEVVALANYLNDQGAKISGAGTPIITIEGVKKIHGGSYQLIPDRLETAAFTIMGLLTKSQIEITNCNPEHLQNLWWHLKQAGAKLELGHDYVITKPSGTMKATNIITHEYPGFATDFQAPYTVLMTQAAGHCLIHETIFEGRLYYTDLLNSMGANIIMCDPHRVVVTGPTPLKGRYLTSPDIRAGMALILASLVARGETIIDNIYQVERGYENIAERLARLGAKISRQPLA